MSENLGISICTVCMNRLNHLKQTLIRNLKDNADFPLLEFVLLDYNSSDGLENWVKVHLMPYIEKGRLKYYRTCEPENFHRSHSRNLAFRLAANDIICNVDADNFTGKDFAAWLANHFQKNPDSYLSVDLNHEKKNISDTFGRIACKKEDFNNIKGFDEIMSGYGYEDIDFCERLKRSGLSECHIDQACFLQALQHSDEERLKFESESNRLPEIYIRYQTPFSSVVIFLFKDTQFSMGTLLDHREGFGNPTLLDADWLKGKWNRENDIYQLKTNNGASMIFRTSREGNLLGPADEEYYRILKSGFLKSMIMNYSIISNHQQYLNNHNLGNIQVNKEGFGKGIVIQNFTNRLVLK